MALSNLQDIYEKESDFNIKNLENYYTFNSDCLTALKEIPNQSIDFILTDPPYNLGLFMKNRQTNLKALRANHFSGALWDHLEFDQWSYNIDQLFNEFSRKHEKIQKEQELKADKYGANASESSKVFINALSKLYIYNLVWNDTKEKFNIIAQDNKKNKIKNLSLEFVQDARQLLEKDKLKMYLENLQFFEQVHPSDTHPPLKDRMKNLDVEMKEISNKSLANFLPSAASLIPNIDIIEENLTLVSEEIEKSKNES